MADEEYSEQSSESQTAEKPDRAEFLSTARKRFEDCSSDEKPIREQAELDLRFVAGDQWESSIKTERTAKGRPALTFNRCHTFVQVVSNEARQNKPQIKFIPAEDADQDTAEVYEGLARHIQYSSDAQVAYETAVEYSAGGSFGYYRFLTDYCDDDSWDQELKVVPVLDPFAVYGILIPACFGMEPQFAFVVEELPVAEYKRLYNTDDIENVGWDTAAKLSQGWIGTDTVRVAEYWYLEHTPKEVKRKNPTTGEPETRTVDKCTVHFCKIDGFRVIPDTDTVWPGYCIPIIPVLGKQIILDGKPNLFSVVRFQRDPQQLINFYKTRIAETLGTQPIQPWVVTEGQLKGHEKEWEQQNVTMRPYLTVADVTGVNGQPLAPPQRQVLEPPIQSLSGAAAQEIDDMKATAGIFDASLGAKGNETSGKGILARQQQSNVTNMHFMDNLERAFRKGGRVIEDVIPKIYDASRMISILGEDEAPKIVKINTQYQDGNGKPKHYKIGGDNAIKGHVIVTMGRAFSTKRMESFDMMTQVLQTSPNLLPMIGDIFFRNSDMAGSEQLAERFKKMLPPQLQDDNPDDPKAQVQQLQGQLMQTKQQLQQIDALAKKLQDEHNAKQVENQAKIQIAQMQEQTRVTIELAKLENQRAIAEITTKAQDARERAKLDADLDSKLHVSAHDVAMNAVGHSQAKELADQKHAQALEAGQQQADNAAATQASDQVHQQQMAQQQEPQQ